MSFSSGRVSPSSYSLAAAGTTTPTGGATLSVPEPPQRRSFSRLLQPQQQRPTSEIFESRHQNQHQREEALTPTPTMPSYRFDQQRPITPLSQKSRPKSPSLQSLKNGFRKATNCVRRPQHGYSDGSDGEGDMKPAASLISMQPSTTTSSNNSSSLYAAISKPTPVNGNNNNSKRYEEIDAVEEAIRSLESFDPNKIIADVAAEKKNNGKISSGSDDSDSGSVIRKDQIHRPSESPTSSGIVADIRDGSITRTSGFSNRSSGGSSHERGSISSSDNDTGSYILVHPNKHLFNPPSTSTSIPPASTPALPQPPAISRIAHQGSFGASPQRATIVASPSSSTTSTLTRGEHIPPQRINDSTFRPQPQQPLPPPPEIITQNDSINNESEDAAVMRKRILCAQLTDCAKVIEINGLKMQQFTSSSNWRHPHLLQRNIPGIQDTVYIIEAALDELLEFTQRISIGRGDPKQDEFIQMVAPLRTSQALIHRLRATLDSAQWNIHSLSRINGNPVANDALDQFNAILYQLPKDCRKLVQWVYLLGTPSQGGANFLPRHSPGAQPFPIISSATPTPESAFEKHQQQPIVPEYLAPRSGPRQQQPPQRPPPPIRQQPQQQMPQQQPPQRPPPPIRQQPQQQIPSLSLLSAPTMEEIAMDGGESTTSSNGSSNATDIVQHQQQQSSITPTIEQSPLHLRTASTTDSIMEEDDLISIAGSTTTKQVYEEDDLMSVMSESSLYQDYSLLGENGSLPRPHQRLRTNRTIPKVNTVLFKDISESEKDLLRPYAFELDNHMSGLCQLIEEFFNIIEQSREPSNFVQKVRLLILKAQFLVNIGDHMAQCIAKPALRSEFRHASDRLNGLLTQCVSNAQIAKEQYPSVEAVQAMMSSVVAVSDAAQHLKQLGKSCI
uniref:CAS family C-terminal domain-containing protein n=1 Tax=Panagrolaimus sp. PS1159 TaxID=55785 RepID=A0AC35FX08_9BILA